MEINYYPSFHLNGRCFIKCIDDTCVLKLDVIDRKDTSKIWWSEAKTVPAKYLNDVKKIFETASHLTSSEPYCLDGMHVNGTFESGVLHHKFICHCPFEDIQYDFVKQSIKTMQKVLKKRKSKRYLRIIREYL